MRGGIPLRFEGVGLVFEFASQPVQRVPNFPVDRDVSQVAASRSFFSQV
jgi:hypothetical protein